MAGSRPRFQVASRSGGKAVCAMAAYRSGERIHDQTYAKTHDYGDKDRVLHTEILAPDYAPAWAADRTALWNAVEQAELKKDGSLKHTAQLAREIVVPLAHELDLHTNREALREWVDAQFVSAGMVADIAIHAPSKDGDQRNIHAHVMLTMREITPEGFHARKATPIKKSWDKTDFLEHAVDEWEATQNRALERAGFDVRVDFSSFESRGIDQEPQQHEGVAATEMRRRGGDSRVAAANDNKRQRNDERARRHLQALHEIVRVEEERSRFEEWKARKLAEMDTAQRLSMIDLERQQLREAIDQEDRLQAFYEPSLQAVEAEAAQLDRAVHARGILPAIRRLWQGRKDKQRLAALEATMDSTRRRMKEARDRLAALHAEQRHRLELLQAQRRAQQAEGIERREEAKRAALDDRKQQAEQEAQETASPKTPLAAELDRVRDARQRWKEKRKEDLLKATNENEKPQERDKGLDFDM